MPQPHIKQKHTLDFIVAHYAPFVIALLSKDKTAERVFDKDIMARLAQYASKDENRASNSSASNPSDERAIMQAFIKAVYPHNLKLNAPTLRFICKSYLEHRHNQKPILAEDFYKIAQNLSDFESFKKSGLLKNNNQGDITNYQSYGDFLATLAPLQEKRDAKKTADAARKISANEKAQITAETTILYDGALGQIVIPHTVRASQYWGANTKWCLAGHDQADIYFPDYNTKSPILFIIPKGLHHQKIALVDKTFWDAKDNIIDALPKAHFNLFQNMLKNQPEDIAEALLSLIKSGQFKIDQSLNEKPRSAWERALLPPPPPPEWQDALAQILQDALHFRPATSISPALLKNKNFMLHAIKQSALALHYAPPSIRNNRELMLLAVSKSGVMLEYASPALRRDPEIIRIAVKQNGLAIKYACPRLLNDRAFVLSLVKQSGTALVTLPKRWPKSFHDDREIVIAAVKQNGLALQGAANHLKDDPDVVMTAVKQHGYALQYASYKLLSHRPIAMVAVKESGLALEFADDSLKDDRAVVMAAVKQNGEALQFASEHLIDDEEIVLAAVTSSAESLAWASYRLTQDLSFMVKCAKINPDCLHRSGLEQSVVKAITLKATEDLMAQGDYHLVKKIFTRYHPNAWGDIKAQFGNDPDHLSHEIITEMKAHLSPDERIAYDQLPTLKKPEIPHTENEKNKSVVTNLDRSSNKTPHPTPRG